MDRDNDYFGMAQECRNLRYRYRRFMDTLFARFSTPEEIEFMEAVIWFEQYCLDQPATIEMGE